MSRRSKLLLALAVVLVAALALVRLASDAAARSVGGSV
jgi:flagellar biogenesis protein FliO